MSSINNSLTFDLPCEFEDLQKQLAAGSYYVKNVLHWKKNGTIRNLGALKKGFVLAAELKNSFVHGTELKKGSEKWSEI